MDSHQGDWDTALLAWRDQDLALFAKRAHAQLGRGFVLVERREPRPIYVTAVAGAPPQLIAAVSDYNPQEEALLVREDDEVDAITIDLVKIPKLH
jgi:hypothetical protein